MPEVGGHYRPADDDHPPGVYRVVGTESVTLLRVADDDGRRRHTGELYRVDPATLAAEFERAADPDAGISPTTAVRELLQGLYWSVRQVLPYDGPS